MSKTPDRVSKLRQKLKKLKVHWEGRYLAAITPEQKAFCLKEIKQINQSFQKLSTGTASQRAAGFGGW